MTAENRVTRDIVLALVVVFTVLCCPRALCAGGDADLRELSRYTLTLSDLQKYSAANSELAKHQKPEEESEHEDGEGSDAESLDDIAKRIDSVPEARKALAAAGLTSRQYAVITMALMQAAFAQFAIDQGADPAKVAKDAGVNPANIRFVKEHKAELEKLNAKPRSDD